MIYPSIHYDEIFVNIYISFVKMGNPQNLNNNGLLMQELEPNGKGDFFCPSIIHPSMGFAGSR